MKAAIDIRNLTVCYGKLTALLNLTTSLPRGHLIAVVGPNGSGKTTLLKAVLDLIPLHSGTVRVLGKPFRSVRNFVSYVPQVGEVDWNFPLLVWEAVAMGRCRPGKIVLPFTAYDRKVIEESMEKMGLSSLAHRPISQLSGGQKQRVFLARALAREAELYLLDEPFTGIDETTEKIIKEHLCNLKNEGKTSVVVHHRLKDVYNNFDFVVVLNNELIAFGPTSKVFNETVIERAYQDFLFPVLGNVEEKRLCTEL